MLKGSILKGRSDFVAYEKYVTECDKKTNVSDAVISTLSSKRVPKFKNEVPGELVWNHTHTHTHCGSVKTSYVIHHRGLLY